MATQQPWDWDNPTGTLYCPAGEGCPSWQPLPEAFPVPVRSLGGFSCCTVGKPCPPSPGHPSLQHLGMG